MKLAVLCLILFCVPIYTFPALESLQSAPVASELKIEVIPVVKKAKITAYSLSVNETDGNPDIGAGNHNLRELQKTTRVCASRDLPLHSFVYIESIGVCEVLDRMNARYKGTGNIDLLMNSKQESLNFGVKYLGYATF